MIVGNNFNINGIVNNNRINNKNNIQNKQTEKNSFQDLLEDKIKEKESVKFSKHAELRLKSRQIQLSSVQREKLNNAVKKAEEKGVNDSLVLMDNVAFVVSIKNKTVITALNEQELKDNVFTNIDGAIIV